MYCIPKVPTTVHTTIAERFFLLRQYTLGDRVWAGITRRLITALDVAHAARSAYDRSGIVVWTVNKTLTGQRAFYVIDLQIK